MAFSDPRFPLVPSMMNVGLLIEFSHRPGDRRATSRGSERVEGGELVRVVADVAHRAERKDGAEPVGAFRDEECERATGAMSAQVHAAGVDRFLARDTGRRPECRRPHRERPP